MTREHEKELYEQYEDICNQHKSCADCNLYRESDSKTLSKCDCTFFYQKGMKEFAEKLKEKIIHDWKYGNIVTENEIDRIMEEMGCNDE